MRRPAFCICENKGADQLTDARLLIQLISALFSLHAWIVHFPLLPKSEILSLLPYSVAAKPPLCQIQVFS